MASLSCRYSVERYGLSRVCWGRGCGTFWCNNILVQTDEHGVITKVSWFNKSRITASNNPGYCNLVLVQFPVVEEVETVFM